MTLISSLKEVLDRIDSKLTGYSRVLTAIETIENVMKARLDRLEGRIIRLETGLDRLENALKGKDHGQ